VATAGWSGAVGRLGDPERPLEQRLGPSELAALGEVCSGLAEQSGRPIRRRLATLGVLAGLEDVWQQPFGGSPGGWILVVESKRPV
jgi:hypothetical protein